MPVPAGATRTSVTWGNFHVPAFSTFPDTIYRTSKKPCTDCYIVAMQAELEYLNGTVANFDSGTQLHHFMHFNENRNDKLCPELHSDVFLAVGNDQTIWKLDHSDSWGYYIEFGKGTWRNDIEITNDSGEAKDLQVTVTYDWVPRASEKGRLYSSADVIWVNDGPQCDGGVQLVAEDGVPLLKSAIWVSTVEGPILSARPHLHDGALNATLYRNGKSVCIAEPAYGTRGDFVDLSGVAHISNSGGCTNVAILEKGDEMYIEAFYDSEKAMRHHGKLDYMSVWFMYVGAGGPCDKGSCKRSSGRKQVDWKEVFPIDEGIWGWFSTFDFGAMLGFH